MSELISSQSETKIAEINHGGDNLFEYTYVNGAKHVYRESAESGKKEHISHDEILVSQGYSPKPDVDGNYLLPSHPNFTDDKNPGIESVNPSIKVPVIAEVSKGGSSNIVDHEDSFFSKLRSFHEQTGPVPPLKYESEPDQENISSKVLSTVRIPEQSKSLEQKTTDDFNKKFRDFQKIDNTNPRAERYQPKHSAEKRYKTRMRKLGKPIFNLLSKGSAWIDEKLKVEETIEKPIRPRNKIESQLYEFNKDLKENKVANQLRMFDADLEYRAAPVQEKRPEHKPTDAGKFLLQMFPPEETSGQEPQPRHKAA